MEGDECNHDHVQFLVEKRWPLKLCYYSASLRSDGKYLDYDARQPSEAWYVSVYIQDLQYLYYLDKFLILFREMVAVYSTNRCEYI
jgi:hypothetical protein